MVEVEMPDDNEIANVAGVPGRQRRWPRLRLEERLFDALGDDWGGNTAPPGSVLTHRIHEWPDEQRYTCASTIGNDGFDLWIGYNDRWWGSMEPADARRLAWFILWRWWARGTWFGLRRKVWYWLLHRRVTAHQRWMRGRDA